MKRLTIIALVLMTTLVEAQTPTKRLSEYGPPSVVLPRMVVPLADPGVTNYAMPLAQFGSNLTSLNASALASGTVPTSVLSRTVVTFTNISQMVSQASTNVVARVLSYWGTNGAGGGDFTWAANGSTNLGTCFASLLGGVWVRMQDSPKILDLVWFGVVGCGNADGTTRDETMRIQNCFDTAPNGALIRFPSLTLAATGLTISNRYMLTIEGDSRTFGSNLGWISQGPLLCFIGLNGGTLMSVMDSRSIVFRGIGFDSETPVASPTNHADRLMVFDQSAIPPQITTDCAVENCTFRTRAVTTNANFVALSIAPSSWQNCEHMQVRKCRFFGSGKYYGQTAILQGMSANALLNSYDDIEFTWFTRDFWSKGGSFRLNNVLSTAARTNVVVDAFTDASEVNELREEQADSFLQIGNGGGGLGNTSAFIVRRCAIRGYDTNSPTVKVTGYANLVMEKNDWADDASGQQIVYATTGQACALTSRNNSYPHQRIDNIGFHGFTAGFVSEHDFSTVPRLNLIQSLPINTLDPTYHTNRVLFDYAGSGLGLNILPSGGNCYLGANLVATGAWLTNLSAGALQGYIPTSVGFRTGDWFYDDYGASRMLFAASAQTTIKGAGEPAVILADKNVTSRLLIGTNGVTVYQVPLLGTGPSNYFSGDLRANSFYGDGSHLTGTPIIQTPWATNIDGAGNTLSNAQLVLPIGSLATGGLSIGFAGDSGAGWYRNAANQWTFVTGGNTPQLSIFAATLRMQSATELCWGSGHSATAQDTSLFRASPGTLLVKSNLTAMGTISGTNGAYFGGSVGIATNNPQSALHVVGSIRSTGGYFEGDGSHLTGISAVSQSPWVSDINAAGYKLTNASSVNATSIVGTHSGDGSALTGLNAGNLSSGTVSTARLGSGTANSSTYLRGDGSWASVSSTNGAATNAIALNGGIGTNTTLYGLTAYGAVSGTNVLKVQEGYVQISDGVGTNYFRLGNQTNSGWLVASNASAGGFTWAANTETVNGTQLVFTNGGYFDLYGSAFRPRAGIYAPTGATSSEAYGNGASASGTYSTSVGGSTLASGTLSTAIGYSAQVYVAGANGTAIGEGSTVQASGGTALGQGANAYGQNSTSVGQGSTVSHYGSTALGQGATTTAANQTMLGASGVNAVVGNGTGNLTAQNFVTPTNSLVDGLILTTTGNQTKWGSLPASALATNSPSYSYQTLYSTGTGTKWGSNYRVVTTNSISATLTLDQDVIFILGATGLTFTLPPVYSCPGKCYTIKNAMAGSQTVAGNGGDTIDGAATYTLGSQYKYVTVVNCGNGYWSVIGNN